MVRPGPTRPRRRAVRAEAAALLLLVGGCATAGSTALMQPSAPGTPGATPTGPGGASWATVAAKALAAWAQFPADADPRPVVQFRDDLWFDVGGFTGQAPKFAFSSGDWTAPAQLPTGPTTYQGHPIITAKQALDQMRTALHDPDAKTSPGSALAITDVKLGTGTVHTDRGPLTVPAWQFSFTGATGPAQVPAYDRPFAWTVPGGGDSSYPTAVQIPGGRELSFTVHTPGEIDPGMVLGRDPCRPTIFPEEAHVEVAETAHAVAFNVVWTPLTSAHAVTVPADPNTGCTAHTEAPPEQTVTLHLDAPLGNRVLLQVDDAGNSGAVEVDPAK